MKRHIFSLNLFIILSVIMAINTTCQKNGQNVYDFERTREGWVVESHRAVGGEGTPVLERTELKANCGKYSLKLKLDMDRRGRKPSQAEIRVDLLTHAPGNQKGPLNLENRTVTAYVFFPKEFEGESNSPNGIQLFAKSTHKDKNGKEHWKSLYGRWHNATGSGGDWYRVRIDISANPGDGIYIEKGFNPRKVRYIGVKFALGTNAVNAHFTGDVFIDCIHW